MKKLVKTIDDTLFNEAFRRAWVNGKQIRNRRFSGALGRSFEALRRERSVPLTSVAEGPDVPRFIGGVSGRSGTTWLTRLVTDQSKRTHAAIGEQGLFVLSMLRSAPYEYYQFGGVQSGRKQYLRYFYDQIRRYGYKRRKIYGSGLKGPMRYIPMRAIDMSYSLLEEELTPEHSLPEVEQAFGRFYLRLMNYYSYVLFGVQTGWVSKEPPYGRHAYELFRMMPSAKLVIMVRDGREVALSMYKRKWMDSVRDCMKRWAEFTEMTMDEIDRAPENGVMLVRYEDLITNFSHTLRSIFDFLQLPEPDPEAILSSPDSKLKPFSSSIKKWEKEISSEDIAWFDENCGHINSRIGYRE